MHLLIEKSAFRKGEYVGYFKGTQMIRRGGFGWETYTSGSRKSKFVYVTARTLEELGEKFDQLNNLVDFGK